MSFKSVAEIIFEKLRAAKKRFAPEPDGGPEYDEHGETIYPRGAKILFDAEHPERTTRQKDTDE